MIVRVRSADGTFRFDLQPQDLIETLRDKILENAPSLDSSSLALSNQPRGGETKLSDLSERNLGDLGIKHGDLLFASSEKKLEQEQLQQSSQQQQQQQQQEANQSNRFIKDKPWMSAKEEEIDKYWNTRDGRIPKAQQSSSSREGNLNTLPIEPYDKEYHAQHNIKHLSFHAYLRRLKDSNPPTSSVAQLPPLEELNYTFKQWVPAAITLQVQEYRMVDHVEFSSPTLIEDILSFWRATATQRFGFLIGRYLPYDKVPMGIKAVVEAIHEIPQEGEIDGLNLGLPWDDDERINEMANDQGLQVLGMIFTDLNQPKDSASPLCKRHADSYFLSSLEMVFASKMQNLHKLSTKFSKSGKFQSRFITCVLSGTPEGGVDVSAYQVSDQAMALVEADIVEPSVEPNTVRLKESIPGRYVPDVFYRYKNEYNIDVKRNARPCFPVEYLLVNVSHGFPNDSSNALFKSNKFPIENRPGLHDQSLDRLIKILLPIVKTLNGVHFSENDDQDVLINNDKNNIEDLKNNLSDWHLVNYLELSGIFSRNESKLCLSVAVNKDDESLKNFINCEGWKNLMAFVREEETNNQLRSVNNNGNVVDDDIPADVLAESEAIAQREGRDQREQREQEQRGVEISSEDRIAIENLCSFGGFDFENAKQAYLACEKNAEMAANLLFESM